MLILEALSLEAFFFKAPFAASLPGLFSLWGSQQKVQEAPLLNEATSVWLQTKGLAVIIWADLTTPTVTHSVKNMPFGFFC